MWLSEVVSEVKCDDGKTRRNLARFQGQKSPMIDWTNAENRADFKRQLEMAVCKFKVNAQKCASLLYAILFCPHYIVAPFFTNLPNLPIYKYQGRKGKRRPCLHGKTIGLETRPNMRTQHCDAEFEYLKNCENSLLWSNSMLFVSGSKSQVSSMPAWKDD